MLAIDEQTWNELVGVVPGGGLAVSGDGSEPPPLLTLPNLVTLAGYAAGLAWLAGASPVWAFVSLWADELDGHLARESGQTSDVGAKLDLGVDWCLGAAMALKLGVWWLAPATLFAQVILRERVGFEPPIGSARAAAMVYALARGL